MITGISKSQNSVFFLIHFGFAFLSTVFLFYLDEGYHNFRWMLEPGNWIAFIIYASFFLFIQWAVQATLLKELKGYLKTILSCVIGSFFLIITLILVYGHAYR